MNIIKMQQLTNHISQLRHKKTLLENSISNLKKDGTDSEEPMLIYETNCWGHNISVDDYLCAIGGLRLWLKNPDHQDSELLYPRSRIKTEDDALDCQLKIEQVTEFSDSWSDYPDDVTYFKFYCYIGLSEEDIQKELTSYEEEIKIIESKIKDTEDELRNLFKEEK